MWRHKYILAILAALIGCTLSGCTNEDTTVTGEKPAGKPTEAKQMVTGGPPSLANPTPPTADDSKK